MAIGRRKRLAANTTSLTTSVTMYTAPAAPADGSAAATVTTLTLTNAGASTISAFVYLPGALLHYSGSIAAGLTISVPCPIDLMGAEAISVQQNVAQRLDYSLSGVVASDT